MSRSLERRVAVVEAKMEWSQETFQRLESNQEFLKQNFIKLIDRLSQYQAHTDERISALQAHTDERFSAQQAQIHERFSKSDERIIDIHREIGKIHGEIAGIHGTISGLTRWILVALLGGVTILSVLVPLLVKWIL